MQALRERDSLNLLSRSEEINFLRNKVQELTALERMKIPFSEVVQEAKINYEDLSAMGFAYQIRTNFSKIDTIPLFEVKWNVSISSSKKDKEQEKLTNWLKIRLQDSTVVVKAVD